jgi:oligosaccharyltransferase complex subunit beta
VGPILYEGSSLLLDPENPLVLEILVASSSAYSYNPDKPVTEVLNWKTMVYLPINL